MSFRPSNRPGHHHAPSSRRPNGKGRRAFRNVSRLRLSTGPADAHLIGKGVGELIDWHGVLIPNGTTGKCPALSVSNVGIGVAVRRDDQSPLICQLSMPGNNSTGLIAIDFDDMRMCDVIAHPVHVHGTEVELSQFFVACRTTSPEVEDTILGEELDETINVMIVSSDRVQRRECTNGFAVVQLRNRRRKGSLPDQG